MKSEHYEKKEITKMRRKLNLSLIVGMGLIIQFGLPSNVLCYTKIITTPYYQQQEWNWCGAASAQMVLESNTVISRLAPDYPTGTTYQIQEVLFDYIQDNNAYNWHTGPDGLEAVLDPYDPGGHYTQYTNSDDAWSCKKLAWTIEHYEVPPAILINGGAHWIVVIGISTSAAPTQNGPYEIYNFTVHDPGYWAGSLGGNRVLGYDDFICYFDTVNPIYSGPWGGLRVSVCDPDPVSPYLIVPYPREEGPLISPDEALTAAQEAIRENMLYSRPGFEDALSGAVPYEPLEVNWICGPNCWAVPYVKMQTFLTVVIIVDGVDGRFMEASYTPILDTEVSRFYQGLTYPFITRESSAYPGIAMPAASIATDPYIEVVKINFGPEDAIVPYGYLPDYGAAFGDRGNGYSYGWNMDLDKSYHRQTHIDQRFDTLNLMQNHMQKDSNHHAVVWEISLKNGSYKVLAVFGDPSYLDQINHIDIEDTILTDPDPWDGGNKIGSDFDEYEVVVEVADGRLTIQPAENAFNAKFCFAVIESVRKPQNWVALPPYNTLWPLWSPALSPINPLTGVPTPLVSLLTQDTVLPVQPCLTWDPCQPEPWLIYNNPSGGLLYFDVIYGLISWPPPYLLDPITGTPLPIPLKPSYSSLPPHLPLPFVNTANLSYSIQYGVPFSELLTSEDIWGDTCEGDFNRDGDVDGMDLAIFAADFGRTNCTSWPPCEGDFDHDWDVDGSDLAIFASDFGRTDCP